MNPHEVEDFDLRSESTTRPRVTLNWRPQTFSHLISSGAQAERLNAEGGIAVGFAGLKHRPVHVAFEGGQSRTLCIWKTTSHHGFMSVPKIAADLFTLRFATSGAMIRNNLHSDPVLSRVDYGTFVDFEDMRSEEASSEFSAVSTTVTRATLIEASVALDGVALGGTVPFTPAVELKTIGLQALRQTLISLHRRLQGVEHQFDLLAPMLEELLVYQLISAWPTSTSMTPLTPPASTRALGKAIDYIEANLSNRMTLAEIAAVAGIGVRALQLAFRREVGCSPIHYLIDRRLERVHAELQTNDGETIRAIASRWGFIHMSDFTKRYRERFGHPPSVAPTAATKPTIPTAR